MKSFVVDGADAGAFIARVRAEIASHGLEDLASVSRSGDELTVTVSQFGTSIIRYRIEPRAGGFRARVIEETIAPMHRAMLPMLEGKLMEVLHRVGAAIEEEPTASS